MENLITFDNNNALKIKVITVTLNTNILIGDSINVYKIGTATTLENVYLNGFSNTGFTFVKDCVDANRANDIKVAYTVFYI